MNLSYELKEIAVYDTIYIIIDYRVGIFPFSVNISAMLLTRCPMVLRKEVFNLRKSLNDDSGEHDMILESYAKIDSK